MEVDRALITILKQIAPNFNLVKQPDVTTQQVITPAKQELNQAALEKFVLENPTNEQAKAVLQNIKAMKDISAKERKTITVNGVVLDDDPKPCFAEACVQKSERLLSMTIVEGRYHQVKRMMAAVGNHVAGLHRSSIGAYTMPSDLPEGEWRWLYADDLKLLGTSIQD